MSDTPSNTDLDTNKPLKEKKSKSKKEKKLPELPPETEAGTSASQPANPDETTVKETESYQGFFPRNMWFWKPVEPQSEILIKRWSMTSMISEKTENESKQQISTRRTESQYAWPYASYVKEPTRLANQPTLDQLIERKQLQDQQAGFTDDLYRHVDYLEERISATKLNILVAQLNNLLPETSDTPRDSTRTMLRSQPLQLKKSEKVLEIPEKKTTDVEERIEKEIEKKDTLTTKFLAFITRRSNKEKISEGDLSKFVDTVNKMASTSSEDIKKIQTLIEEKPQLLEILRETHKKSSVMNRQKEKQQYDEIRDQIASNDESSSVYFMANRATVDTRNIEKETPEEIVKREQARQKEIGSSENSRIRMD